MQETQRKNVKALSSFKTKLVIPENRINTRYIIPQTIMKENIHKLTNAEDYKWFMEMDFSRFNSYFLKLLYNSRVARKIRKVALKIK